MASLDRNEVVNQANERGMSELRDDPPIQNAINLD